MLIFIKKSIDNLRNLNWKWGMGIRHWALGIGHWDVYVFMNIGLISD